MVGAMPRIPAIVVALAIVGLYFWRAPRHVQHAPPGLLDRGASQALVALIPVLAIVVGTFALIAVAFIAVIALILLFTDRG